AGWYEADPSTLRNTIHEAYAIVANTTYLTAPFSKLYLFGRRFDIGFQRPIKGKAAPRHRHHMRLWQVTDQPHIDTHGHFAYWVERLKHFFNKEQSVWIGAAIEDIDPIGIRWRNLQITHKNSHLHEKERDYFVSTLREAGLVKSVHIIKDGESFTMRSQNIGTSFIVDGNILVVELKSSFIKGI
ncbi:MAG: LssY C-terminal domain-containing protein, partial [Candidatus Saccharimonadales bacterium]